MRWPSIALLPFPFLTYHCHLPRPQPVHSMRPRVCYTFYCMLIMQQCTGTPCIYVRCCMSQVRYNIIFPNAGWALPFAMTTNVSRQQPLATAFGTCTAILLPLAHPGSSTHCYCNNCNPRRCTAVAVAPGLCYNTNGGSCRALHAAWLHKRFAVCR